MTSDELRAAVERLDIAASRVVLAHHALEDAAGPADRIVAGRAFLDAVRTTSTRAHELETELRVLGVSR